MRTMTVAIASYQRRHDVTRLVTSLAQQAQQAPDSWRGVDVVVVLDGSTDGSKEALAGLSLPFPLEVVWQPNKGLAAARNAGLLAARGEIVWFLDDDLVPLPETVDRHRTAHEREPRSMLLGPCDVAPGIELLDAARAYWEDQSSQRAQGDRIERFDLIAIANSSLPAALLRDVGGLDETFVGYGLEDYEVGLRLLRAGTTVRFDPEAACWHYSAVDEGLQRLRRREEGRNLVRFLEMHPEVGDRYFPTRYPSRAMKILDRSGCRSATLLMGISHAAAAFAPIVTRVLGRGHLLRRLAMDASYAAGVADRDRSLLPMVLGRPPGPGRRNLHRVVGPDSSSA